MKQLLLPRNVGVLDAIASGHSLVAFDFDGTLAPIVAARGSAAIRRSTFELFKRVCRLYPTAVISGRSRADVCARLIGAEVKYVVGNHGVERSSRPPRVHQALTEARTVLKRLVTLTPGLELEDKRYSLTVHYRKCPRKRRVHALIVSALSPLHGAIRVVGGKNVVNVVLASAADKGDALLAIRRLERSDIALYVGDDVTDEDVFELSEPARLVTVRVGASASSKAAYFLPDQRHIDVLLGQLISLRAPSRTRGLVRT